jgi:hypothetical protein
MFAGVFHSPVADLNLPYPGIVYVLPGFFRFLHPERKGEINC